MSIHLTSFQSQKTGVSLVPHASSPLRNSPRKPSGSDHGPGGGVRHRQWHPEHIAFVSRTMAGPTSPCGEKAPRRRTKRNGARKDEARLSKRDRTDEALIAEMKSNPDGAIGDWARTIGVSRTTCVSALHRLKNAGLTASDGKRWRLIEEEAPREPAAKWARPIGGGEKAAERHMRRSPQDPLGAQNPTTLSQALR